MITKDKIEAKILWLAVQSSTLQTYWSENARYWFEAGTSLGTAEQKTFMFGKAVMCQKRAADHFQIRARLLNIEEAIIP